MSNPDSNHEARVSVASPQRIPEMNIRKVSRHLCLIVGSALQSWMILSVTSNCRRRKTEKSVSDRMTTLNRIKGGQQAAMAAAHSALFRFRMTLVNRQTRQTVRVPRMACISLAISRCCGTSGVRNRTLSSGRSSGHTARQGAMIPVRKRGYPGMRMIHPWSEPYR